MRGDEQRRDRLRALDDPLDERLALGARRGREAREILLGLGVRLGAHPVEPGLIVPTVADLASEIGERGEALLADLGQPVELCPGRERGRRIGGCEPALEDAEHRRELSLRALVGLLHPEQRHLERAARHVEREPVVGQRPAERLDERRPEPLAPRLGLVQVAPELLERRLRRGVGTRRARAVVERLHVGEGSDHGGLRLERGRVAVRGGVGELAPARAELARLRGAHVEPEDEPLQLCERGEVARADVDRLGRLRGAERERRSGGLGDGLALRVDPHERRAGIDLRVRDGEHLPDDARVRRGNRHLDLHGLDARDGLARRDALARLDWDRHHHRRHGRGDDARGIAPDHVRHPVHLHEQAHPVGRDEQSRAAAAPGKAALSRAEPLHPHLEGRPPHGRDAVGVGADLADVQPVSAPAVPKLHAAARRGTHARPAAACLGHEARPLEVELCVVRLDRRGDERHLRALRHRRFAGSGERVEEPSTGAARADLRAREERAKPRGGRGGAAKEHVALRERLREPLERRGAIVSARDHRRDDRARRRVVAVLERRIGANSGSGGEPKHLDPPRRRAGRDDARGDGVASPRVGRRGIERGTRREEQREPDEVDAGCLLDGGRRGGDRVDACERHAAGAVDGELHRADADPARLDGDPLAERARAVRHLRREPGGRRLHERGRAGGA